MLSAQSQGAQATITSALHGVSPCLVNVVSGPWHIQNTRSVLSLNCGKRYVITNVLRGTSDECSIL